MLDVKVNWNVVADSKYEGVLRQLEAAQTAEKVWYQRLPGTSRSGPCPVCAQYFGVVHDGSGRTVPKIKLHRNCVCRDVIHLLVNELGETPIEPKKRFEWLETVPKAVQVAILGKVRSAVMRQAPDRIEALKAMVGRQTVKKQTAAVAVLAGVKTMKELRVLGLRYGLKPSDMKGLDKAGLIKLIMRAMGRSKTAAATDFVGV